MKNHKMEKGKTKRVFILKCPCKGSAKSSGGSLSKIVESRLGIHKCFHGQHFQLRKQAHNEKQQIYIFIVC